MPVVANRAPRHQMSDSLAQMSHSQDERAPGTEEYLRASTIGELAPLAGPINLIPYDPRWPDRFRYEAERICAALGSTRRACNTYDPHLCPDLRPNR